MMAHNFLKEVQMLAQLAASRAKAKHPTVLKFQKIDAIRHQIIQRAGRVTWP